MSDRHGTHPDLVLDDGDVLEALENLEVIDTGMERALEVESVDTVDVIVEHEEPPRDDGMEALDGLLTNAGQPAVEPPPAEDADPLALFRDEEVEDAPAPAKATDDDERFRREVLALAPSLPTRAALLEAYRARIAADIRGDVPGAVAMVDRAAKLAPEARCVVMTRRWIAGALRSPSATVAAARAELGLAGDATERLALLWQIATVEQGNNVEVTLRQIIELDPQDLGAWLALAASTMQRKSWAAAASAWDTLAQRTEDITARAAFHASAAGLRDAYLKDTDGARRSLERALEADPTSPTAHLGQQALLLHTGAHAELARLVATEASQIGDVDPGLGYWECAGDLLWECAHDAAAAARTFEHAAELTQADVVQLGKLATLYEQEGRHAQLADVYERVLERLNDPQRRGAVLHRLATLYETRLEKPADAIRCYKAALDAVPTLAPAAQALAQQYQATRRFEEAANVLLVEIDRLGDGIVRAARYVSVAELLEGQVGATPQVTGLLERALQLDPAQTAALDALDRIYRAEGRWEDIIRLHEAQLAHTSHELRGRALRMTLANLYLDRGENPLKAAEHLRATLVGPPDRYFVLVSLARALADAGKWPEHVKVLEQQADLLGDGPETVATLYRIANVVESRLGDPARALEAYTRVLEINPRHELALHALLRIHRSQSRWDEVIDAERRLLELIERPEEAAVILHRIALLAEDNLGRIEESIDAYEMALRNLPSYRPARVALERLLRASRRYDRLASLLEEQATSAPPPDRARLFAQAAMIRELHVGTDDSAGAAELYERALSVEAALPTALWGLFRIRTAAEDWKGAAAALASLVRQTRVPAMRSRLLVQLARIHELRLGDGGRAIELLGVALSADATPASVFERLRLAMSQPNADAGRWLMEASTATTDENVASGLLRVRAVMLEQGIADGEQNRAAAAEAYGKALAVAVTPAVVEGLARCSRGAVLAATLQQRARLIKDTSTKTLLFAAAGTLYMNAGPKHAGAADGAYRDALAARPDFMPALAGRRALAEAQGDWETAAQLCAEQATSAMDPTNKVELFELAGKLCVERLGDNARAIAHYREALLVEPGRRSTLDRTLDLLESTGAWKEAAALIASQVNAITDERGRGELYGRRARIRAERLQDIDGAISDIQQALSLKPNDTALLVLLAQLHEARSHWADAARVYEMIARSPKQNNRRKALVAQARIWLREIPDYARAQRLLEAAREIEPDDRRVLADLAEIATKMGDGQRAADLYERLSHLGKPRDRVTALLAAFDLRKRMGIRETESLQPAFELAFEDPEIVTVLEAHYRANNDLSGFATTAEAALTRAPSSERAETLRVALGRVFAREAQVPERAAPYLRSAIQADPGDARLRMALASAVRDDKAAVAELRKAIELDPMDPAPYRRLATTCTRAKMDIVANIATSAAALLGDEGELQPAPSPAAIDRPGANSLLAEEAFALSVGQTRVASLRQFIAQIDPFLHEIFPDNERQLAVAVPLPEKHAIGNAIRAIAGAFGVPSLAVYLRDRGEPSVLATEARAFVVSRDQVSDDAAPRVRFAAGGGLARLAGGALLSVAAPASEVRLLFASLDEAAKEVEGLPEMRKRVSSALPRRVRKDLERMYGEMRIDQNMISTWEREEQSRATRIGLVACADLRAAARVLCPTALSARTADERRQRIRANAQMADAIQFAMSDACWTAIRRMYARG